MSHLERAGHFLHRRNPELHKSTEVETVVSYLRTGHEASGGERIPSDAASKINAYLGFLANEACVNDGTLTGDEGSIKYQVENYTFGDIHRRSSLKIWADHLSGDDYPDWFRFYAFNSVLKMGKFDQLKDRFEERSTYTTTAFPELNEGPLALVYAWVNKAQVGEEVKNEDGAVVLDKKGRPKLNFEVEKVFDDEKRERDFKRALQSGNFAKLYVHAKHATGEGLITAEQRKVTEGSWKKYAQNSDPYRLFDDLHGFGVDWCTVSGIETATSHVRSGDFYVYYTHDSEANDDTVPRIAIKTENGVIDEIRGIGTKQELELALTEIIKQKVQNMPGGEEYIQRAEDVERLDRISKMIAADPESSLSKEDVALLYEIDRPVYGFGLYQDGGNDEMSHPSLEELRAKRGQLDRSELKGLAIERLRDNFEIAYAGYTVMAEQLHDASEVSVEEMRQLFDSKMAEWQQTGVVDYITERFITHREQYTPIFRPNVLASVEEITFFAINFAKRQDDDMQIAITRKLYDSYTSYEELTELCGYRPDQGEVAMSLISNKVSAELGKATAPRQLEILHDLQMKYPELHLKIPSVLDAMALWQVAWLRGDSNFTSDIDIEDLRADDVYEIRHINLPAMVNSRGWYSHPVTSLEYGAPILEGEDPNRELPARISLG